MNIPLPWMVAVVAVLWVLLALQAGLSIGARGRRWWVWFLISVFCTVLPAAVISYVDYFRQLRRSPPEEGAARRCRHCGAPLARGGVRRVGGSDVCAHCGMVIDGDDLA